MAATCCCFYFYKYHVHSRLFSFTSDCPLVRLIGFVANERNIEISAKYFISIISHFRIFIVLVQPDLCEA